MSPQAQTPPRPSTDPLEALLASHRQLLGFVERRVGDRATAEEILQAAFVHGMGKMPELRDKDKVLPWFYQLLRNAIAGHFRHADVERRALESVARDAAEAAAGPELEASVCQCLHGLLPNLKPDYAEILRHVDLGEGSLADYARREGITANNARVRLHRARTALGDELRRSCGTCAEHGCLDCSCQR